MSRAAKLVALMLATALAAGCGAEPAPSSSSYTGEGGTAPSRTVLTNLYYEPELFAPGCANPESYSVEGELLAGMVPHHLLAADMISGFFLLAQEQHKKHPYDAVLIISPSHFPESCGSDIVTANASWSTHLGGIEPDGKIIEAILADAALAAEDNPDAVEKDHGAAGLTPYVRKYLPDVPLAVCLLANKLSRERLNAFQDLLAEQTDGRRVLVVASADCSHYLMPPEATKRDEQTIAAITEGDRRLLLSFSDKNIDSPQSVTSFLRVAAEADAEVKLLGHSSSDKKLPHALGNGVFADGTTTYMVFAAVS